MKNPWLGAFLSAIYPGIGQFYAGNKLRGYFFISIEFLCLILMPYEMKKTVPISFLAFAPLRILIQALSVYDAYHQSKRFNVRYHFQYPDEKKKAFLAVLLSYLLPGLGQFYNSCIGRGVLFIGALYLAPMILSLALVPILIVSRIYTMFIVDDFIEVLLFWMASMLVWLPLAIVKWWSIYDAYAESIKINGGDGTLLSRYGKKNAIRLFGIVLVSQLVVSYSSAERIVLKRVLENNFPTTRSHTRAIYNNPNLRLYREPKKVTLEEYEKWLQPDDASMAQFKQQFSAISPRTNRMVQVGPGFLAFDPQVTGHEVSDGQHWHDIQLVFWAPAAHNLNLFPSVWMQIDRIGDQQGRDILRVKPHFDERFDTGRPPSIDFFGSRLMDHGSGEGYLIYEQSVDVSTHPKNEKNAPIDGPVSFRNIEGKLRFRLPLNIESLTWSMEEAGVEKSANGFTLRFLGDGTKFRPKENLLYALEASNKEQKVIFEFEGDRHQLILIQALDQMGNVMHSTEPSEGLSCIVFDFKHEVQIYQVKAAVAKLVEKEYPFSLKS